MSFRNRKQVMGCIALLATLLTGTVSHAGSLVKLDLASQTVLAEVLESAKVAHETKYPGKDGITFIRSTFTPHTTLLFLSAANDDSDLAKVSGEGDLSSAQLVLNAAQIAANQFSTIEVVSEMRIIHQPGFPNGVPSSGIPAGTVYHSVVIELPAASTALTPLMNALKTEISAVVTRKSATDFPPRIHLTVGYIVGAKTSEVVVVDSLKGQAKFNVSGFTLDFPGLDKFKNIYIPFNTNLQ